MRNLALRSLALGGIIALALVFTGTVSVFGDGAIVFNHADVGASCLFPAFGGTYAGPATLVVAPNGKCNAQCNATLIAGAPVSSATRFTAVIVQPPCGTPLPCDVQITPSGKANVNCHN